MLTKYQLIQRLKGAQGKLSLRQYAAAIKCSPSHLSRLYRGKKNPGPKILKFLKLTKTSVYEK